MLSDKQSRGGLTVRTARGTRACERLLLADLSRLLDESGEACLQHSILIVVPSRSLRAHLMSRLVAHRQRSVAGVTCLTLYALASDIVSRAEAQAPPLLDLSTILARRLARNEASLRRCLEHLSDGYATTLGTVRDLLDAGLEPAHVEALDEALAEEGPGCADAGEVARARSLVRVAARCFEELQELGVGRISTLLQQATTLLRDNAVDLDPGQVLVYGFADATGVATDLIQTLLEHRPGVLYLDKPADPASPERIDRGVEFSRRFSERLLAMARSSIDDPVETSPTDISMFRALGGQAEVLEVARRIRALLDDGQSPEQIAVVTRQPDSYTSAIRTHFWRLGIPFSGFGVSGPRTHAGRRLSALLDLISRGPQSSVDRWLDVVEPSSHGIPPADLRLALYGLGATRVEEVAQIDLGPHLRGDSLSLPIRLGLTEDDDPALDPDSQPQRFLEHRQVPAAALTTLQESARQLGRRFATWRTATSVEEHLHHLRGLLSEDLHRSPVDDLCVQLLTTAERLRTASELELRLDELALWLGETLPETGNDALGGVGGGVQILDVIEARGRTFDHLFLLGMNRGVFPRSVREDPLLPDALRHLLAREGFGVLPDLPRKLAGFDEERFLFAQLLSASPAVTLSWQEVDDDNAQVTISPLVERLRWSTPTDRPAPWARPPLARPLFAAHPPSETESQGVNELPRLAYEHAVEVALGGSRSQLATILPLALSEGTAAAVSWRLDGVDEPAAPAPPPAEVAAARLRILVEMDPSPHTPTGRRIRDRLGPYFGFVGPIGDEDDPRTGSPLFVTALEALAGCPWQTFLRRVLRIEALPDPLEILPGFEPLLIGSLVHRVLEALVRRHLTSAPTDLGEVDMSTPTAVPWPEPAQLEDLLQHQAAAVVRDHGIGLPGFARVLAEVSQPYLEQARRLDWDNVDRLVPTLAVETRGSLEVSLPTGAHHRLHFRADRVDAAGETVLLTDYKTGKKGVSHAKKASTRHDNLLKKIRSGSALQAAAYALAPSATSSHGRYVYLHPDFEGIPEARVITARADDASVQAAFQLAAASLLSAWQQGAFFPRLVSPDRDAEPRRCDRCEVAEACLRGDSGARGRLRDWVDRHLEDHLHRPLPHDSPEQALLAVWLLDSKRLQELDGASLAAPGADSD